jgi:predicted RNase H-like HicB family nuclease
MDEVRTALYRFFDADGRLLYVGITNNTRTRWSDHASKKPWWPQVATATTAWHQTRKEAEQAELDAIRGENPVHNIHSTPQHGPNVARAIRAKAEQRANPAAADEGAYRVTARRSGDWWALQVPELPGVFSQAKRLETADAAAREAIAAMLDTEPEDVQVSVEPVLPEAAARAVARADAARRAAEEAAERAQVAMQAAAAELTKALSQRDAGRVLGVSFQRISQLLKALAENPPTNLAVAARAHGARAAAAALRAKNDKRPARQKEPA